MLATGLAWAQLLPQSTLLLGKLARQRYHDGDMEIASGASPGVGQALTGQAKCGAGLRAGIDGETCPSL